MYKDFITQFFFVGRINFLNRVVENINFDFLFLQENLRKHILSTTLHVGKTIYECDACKAKGLEVFCTNFCKELKAHLINVHAEEYPKPEDVNNFIAGIFDTSSQAVSGS